MEENDPHRSSLFSENPEFTNNNNNERLKRNSHQNLTLSCLEIEKPPKLRKLESQQNQQNLELLRLKLLKYTVDLANSFGPFQETKGSTQYPSMTRIMPNFSDEKALQCWDLCIFSYSELQGDLLVFSKNEMEPFDYQILKLTDIEVVEYLQYINVYMTGMYHSEITEVSEALKNHMKKISEKLLREILFTRNITSDVSFSEFVVQGIIGMMRIYQLDNRTYAINSLLEIAWSICTTPGSNVHPVFKGQIASISTIFSKNSLRRSIWINRAIETLKSTRPVYFILSFSTYFVICYDALEKGDEDTLTVNIVQLEETLSKFPFESSPVLQNFKNLMKGVIELLRADSALIHEDYQNCIYWVDKAEHSLGSCFQLLQQSVFILNFSILKRVCKRIGKFPSGENTVVVEIEKRLQNYSLNEKSNNNPINTNSDFTINLNNLKESSEFVALKFSNDYLNQSNEFLQSEYSEHNLFFEEDINY